MQFDEREKFLSHMLAANRPAGALEIPEEPQWVRHIQLGRLSGLRQALEAKAAEENVGHWLTSREAELTLIINRPLLGGWTLLHHACFYGSVEITRYLLQHGANPASQTDENPERGYLPAHVACILENLMTSAILDLLERFWVPTSHGGRLANCRGPYDRTPLHTAALYGNREAVDWLLKHQADPNVQEDQKRGDGQTPLHNAALRNHPQIIDLLLAGGARWTLRNRGKETPLLTALSYNSPRGDCRAAVLAFIQQGILLSQAEIQAVQSLRVQVRQAIEVRYVQILIEGHLGDMFQRAIEPNRWRAFVAEATSLAKEGSAEHLPVPASTPLSTNPSALWNASCSAAPSSSAPAAPATTPPKPLPASSAVVTSSKHPITAVSKIVLPKPPQLPPEEPAVPPKPTGEPPVPPK